MSRRKVNLCYKTYSVPDLKYALKQRRLKVSGKKADMIARLEKYDAEQ